MPEKQPSKIELAWKLLESAEGNVRSAKQMLSELGGGPASSLREKAKDLSVSGDGRIVEGIFDGQNMVGSDNKQYPVPANYASKSKLVEGDVLKLTILEDGSFIYKQIGPVERRKVVGTLSMDGEEYRVLAGERSYKVLYASVTYFKGKPGDQVTLLLPKDREANWGAVENVLMTPVLSTESPAEVAAPETMDGELAPEVEMEAPAEQLSVPTSPQEPDVKVMEPEQALPAVEPTEIVEQEDAAEPTDAGVEPEPAVDTVAPANEKPVTKKTTKTSTEVKELDI
jgi:hypothetical protein